MCLAVVKADFKLLMQGIGWFLKPGSVSHSVYSGCKGGFCTSNLPGVICCYPELVLVVNVVRCEMQGMWPFATHIPKPCNNGSPLKED